MRLSAASAPSTGRSHFRIGRIVRASASDSSGLSSSAAAIAEAVADIEDGTRSAERQQATDMTASSERRECRAARLSPADRT